MKTLSMIPARFMAATIGLAALMAAPQTAKAASGEYCREYTRTVYIGGRAQDAYGKACLQPDGSWMIVGEGLGEDIPDNVSDVDYIIHDERRDFVPTRVVYVSPKYKKHKHWHREPAFVWYNNGHYRDGHYVTYRNRYVGRGHNYYYNHHDRDDDRGYHRSYDDRRYGWNDRDGESLEIRYRYKD